MKIFHLIKSLGRGGAEMLLPETLRVHDRESFEFAYGYFLDYKDDMVGALEGQGVEVTCFKARRPHQILSQTNAVARYAGNWGADMIHCHLPMAGVVGRLAGRIAGIPVVYTEHNLQERYHPLTRRANLLTMPMNRHIITVSADVEQSLRRHLRGRNLPVSTLLNGVNTQRFSPDQYSQARCRRELGLPADVPVVGTVAVFRTQKRLNRWLELAAQLTTVFPEIQFLLVGSGPEEEALRKRAGQLGIADRIHFPGRLEEVRPWLAAIDIYLMTSEFEGLPIAMLEAMSMELPVVATAAGGIPEVIRHGQEGLLMPVDEVENLLPYLKQLLNDKEKRTQMGRLARSRVQEAFSIDTMAEGLEALYLKIMQETSGAAIVSD